MAGLLLGFLLLTQFVNGEGSTVERKCLIIVSGHGGYSQHELGKASSFRDHLLEDISEDDIKYLTDPDDPDSDGPANVSNIENAFDWLKDECDSNTEVLVYIFDHIVIINSEETFLFDDGNITASAIDSWLDDVSYSKTTIILNGERSGLGGPDLTGSYRDVICSMRSYQTNDPDLFNITRSLKDPSADLDSDGVVSFVEAFWNEVILLRGTGQDPVLFN
jgi:hypothetical protein